MTAGVAFGWRWGAAAGVFIATSRLAGLLAPDVNALIGIGEGIFRSPPRLLERWPPVSRALVQDPTVHFHISSEASTAGSTRVARRSK